MIVLAAAMMLAGGDADLRHGFVECLKSASAKAETQKISADGFVDFAKTACASAEEPFKSVLVDTNVRHGMSRKESAADANGQLNDYYSEWKAKYSEDLPPATPSAAPAVAPVAKPAPTPASEPTQPH